MEASILLLLFLITIAIYKLTISILFDIGAHLNLVVISIKVINEGLPFEHPWNCSLNSLLWPSIFFVLASTHLILHACFYFVSMFSFALWVQKYSFITGQTNCGPISHVLLIVICLLDFFPTFSPRAYGILLSCRILSLFDPHSISLMGQMGLCVTGWLKVTQEISLAEDKVTPAFFLVQFQDCSHYI